MNLSTEFCLYNNKIYLSSCVDLSLVGKLISCLVLLSSLQSFLSSSFVSSSSALSQLLESRGNFSVSLFFLSQSFGLGGYYFCSCHLNHKIINYYKIIADTKFINIIKSGKRII